ncbi:ABC transporter ATP-binding protein [Sulfurimonas sp.]|uniref:ABC transporter ATP-binding protein n=1 Tax=Sulfurimonas sp. TaxID=2022749 RepID=UPI00261AFFEF|nr:ABC transporter ATP-binding protein [Sulfurimonas sp.]
MIQIQNLNKDFKEKNGEIFHALKNITLSVAQGEFVLLKGVSGSGKSTLLHILASQLKPTSGSVEVAGENIASYSDYHASLYRRDITAYITQSFHLFNALTVEENLLPALVIKDLNAVQINAAQQKAMELANIAHKAKQKVSNLSGGEKQRAIIARAIVSDAQIILCDEPTANLDKENSLLFIEILTKLKAKGKTIIIATHDPIFDTCKIIDKSLSIKEGTLE